jgi:hypothetical protein
VQTCCTLHAAQNRLCTIQQQPCNAAGCHTILNTLHLTARSEKLLSVCSITPIVSALLLRTAT